MYILLGTLDGSNFKGEILSYEGPFGVGYGVVKFVVEDNSESKLKNLINERDEKFRSKREAANPYTKLARKSLSYYFANGTELKDLADVPTELLNKKHGVFVSLKKFGALRGCIGTISPITNSVAEEIIRNAIEAAINDPRFPAVNEDELQYIDVSVDELMEAEKVKIDELNPKKYGVIVTSGYRRGLLLPDLEGVDTIEEQIRIALGKAGIKIDEEYTIERFEVVRHKEGEE